RSYRDLRFDDLFGGAADAGDRDPDGVGSRTEQGTSDGDATRHDFCPDWYSLGPRRSLCAGEANFQFTVRRNSLGSIGLWSDSAGAARNGRGCYLVASAASDTRGSGDRFAAELKAEHAMSQHGQSLPA